jgi:hypothetical protein
MDDSNQYDFGGTVLTPQFVPAAGDYYLAYAFYDFDPVDSAGQPLWNDQNPQGHYFPEWAPNGPGGAHTIAGWSGAALGAADYRIVLSGTCFVGGAACYANCDNSTSAPILNANDFQCFLNKYAAQDPGANCDGSTAPPALNANDFQCFLNAYAAGCP